MTGKLMPKSSEIEGRPAMTAEDEKLVERLDAATERLRAYTNAAVGTYTVPGAVDRLAVKQDDVYMAHYRLDEAASAISRLSTEVQELRAALNRERTLGGYDAFADVLAYLNTIDTKIVEKKTVYAAVMEMRPPVASPLATLTTPRYITEYHEDMGPVLWWHYPVQEPPYVGSTLDTDFEANWHTWWTPLPDPKLVMSAFKDGIERRSRAALKPETVK